MKKFLVSIVCMAGVALLAACGTTLGSAEASAERAAAVKQALADRNFKIDVNFMYPMRGSSRNLTSEYSLEVRNDSLFSHLPYMGEARNLPYANRGYVFKKASLRKLFSKFWWYMPDPSYRPSTADFTPREWRLMRERR